LVNLKHNKFVIDTGTIIVKGVNDDVLERMLHLFKKVGVENVMARLKNVGDIGRSMQDQDNYTMEELIELASKQTGLSVDYINEWRHKPIYQNTEPEIDSFIFPMKPEQEGKLLHKSGIWFKIANWKGDEGQTIPLRNNKRRGRLTPEFKVAPFFEHVKMNEGGY
jgi:predicted PilT family ATPase